MNELPCGDGPDARYCPVFWSQNADVERLKADLDAARSALQAAQDDSGALRAEVRDLREKLRVVIYETPPELRYDWADQYLSALLPGEEIPQRVKIVNGRHVPLHPDECEPHTPGQPDGVAQWHEWREEMEKTHVQRQCKGCGLWAVWEPKPQAVSGAERQDGGDGK